MTIKKKVKGDEMDERVFFTDKVLYRVVKFLHLYLGYDILNENYKLLWLDKVDGVTEQEIKIKNYVDAFKYLNGNFMEGITNQTIIKSYFLLTGKRIGKRKLEEILVSYYSLKEASPYVNATVIHQVIHKTKLIRKTEFATLLSNFVLMAANRCPFIIFQSEVRKYNEARKVIQSDYSLMYNFILSTSLFMDKSNESINENKLKFNKSEILCQIYELKDYIQSQFCVESIYLYGSVNSNLANEYSDVDMLVVFREGIPIYKKYGLLDDCRLDLEKKLNIKIDLVEVNQGISIFGTRGIKKSTKIF